MGGGGGVSLQWSWEKVRNRNVNCVPEGGWDLLNPNIQPRLQPPLIFLHFCLQRARERAKSSSRLFTACLFIALYVTAAVACFIYERYRCAALYMKSAVWPFSASITILAGRVNWCSAVKDKDKQQPQYVTVDASCSQTVVHGPWGGGTLRGSWAKLVTFVCVCDRR